MTAKRSFPDEIRVLVERLRTQDNLATAEPLYCVEQKVRIYGISTDYVQDGDGDNFVWHSEDWESVFNSPDELVESFMLDWSSERGSEPSPEERSKMVSEVTKLAQAAWDRGDDVTTPDGVTYDGCHYNERWEFVTAHFTAVAAQKYLDSNKHHFPHGGRVFVTSQYRCHEWNAVREFLLQLADDEVPKLTEKRSLEEELAEVKQERDELRSLFHAATESASRSADEIASSLRSTREMASSRLKALRERLRDRSANRSFEEDLKRVIRTLVAGVDAMQVGHAAPWTTHVDGYTWELRDDCDAFIWETQDGEFEGEHSAQKRLGLICCQVNTAADLAVAIAELPDDAPLEDHVKAALAVLEEKQA